MKPDFQDALPIIQSLASRAGDEILHYYRSGGWSVQEKADLSPVTHADIASNRILVPGLDELNFGKVISEESNPASEQPESQHWLVDPLDGTKEFIAGRPEFVISIGFIYGGDPIFGLIHAPVTKETYWAEKGRGLHGPSGRIEIIERHGNLVAAGSRSLREKDLAKLKPLFDQPIASIRRLGSALKFAHLADGRIDLYPRFGPTGEWDTAAGQVLVEEAGGRVLDLKTGRPLRYGKSGFLNTDGFLALGSGL